MDMMGLAAVVCRALTLGLEQPLSGVVEVKDGNARDVVTSLDLRLHDATRKWVNDTDPSIQVLSEEGVLSATAATWSTSRCLVVDPLDGSNNYSLSAPGFGYLAALLDMGRVKGSLVVLPETNLYLVWDGTDFKTSRPLRVSVEPLPAPVYFAYPPRLNEDGLRLREVVLRVIDLHSPGFYRYGSACVGMSRLLTGAHSAFVGHQVRIWDVLAFFPILAHLGFTVRYQVKALTATVVVSRNEAILQELLGAFAPMLAHPLELFDPQKPLLVAQS